LEKKDVIKHSGAIQVSANQISLLQRKIWNILLANAFDDLLSKDEYSIKIKDLAEILKFDSNDIELVKEAVTKMQKVLVQWNVLEKDDEAWISSQFLGEVNITKQSGVYLYLGKISQKKLYNPTMYAKISLAVQSKFRSKYALILYELCLDYFIKKQGKGETPWIDVEDFRKLMGADNDKYYSNFKYLNRKVLNVALNEVNKESDIFIKVSRRMESRKVVALNFTYPLPPALTIYYPD
jgi:plasmid replication initiation protein